jgi:hypothetical protein
MIACNAYAYCLHFYSLTALFCASYLNAGSKANCNKDLFLQDSYKFVERESQSPDVKEVGRVFS